MKTHYHTSVILNHPSQLLPVTISQQREREKKGQGQDAAAPPAYLLLFRALFQDLLPYSEHRHA